MRCDLPRLGGIAGLDVVHLQCHIGTDTVSLARLGARSGTGLDFWRRHFRLPRDWLRSAGQIQRGSTSCHRVVDTLGSARFDLVFTGIGAINSLPDIHRWGQTVASLLRPGGRLFMREGHPMLWTLADPLPDDLVVVEFPYFETEGVRFSEPLSYVDHVEPLTSPDIVHFNHGLSEVIMALMDAGLRLTSIEEHDTVPWNPLGTAMEDTGGGEFRLRHNPKRLAATYTLQAIKSH